MAQSSGQSLTIWSSSPETHNPHNTGRESTPTKCPLTPPRARAHTTHTRARDQIKCQSGRETAFRNRGKRHPQKWPRDTKRRGRGPRKARKTPKRKATARRRRTVPATPARPPSPPSGDATLGGRILQMPVFSAKGRMRPIKLSGSVNSSQLGSKTGHSGGGTNSAA